jgi:flagellar biosynthetic protein FliQ
MDPQSVIDLGRQAIMVALLISAPVLIVGTLVGLVVGLLQALTQVQDQTVSFVPKIVAMVLVLSLCLPWLIQQMVEYSSTLYRNVPKVIAGGG